MLGYAVLFFFLLTSFLSYIERFIGKYKLPIYITIGAALIILAATREIGIDPDSENYENAFLHHYSSTTADMVEYSFILISQIIQLFSNDVHYLFLFYAIFGVTLKFVAFRKLCEFWFLPLVVYISYYYIFHELMQIRTGIMAGMFLLAIKPLGEGKRLKAFFYIAIGFIFHYSALALLPLLFLSNKPMSTIQRTLWALIIPFGYMIHFYGFTALLELSTELPYIGQKLAAYQLGTERGNVIDIVNVFNLLFIITNILYLYLLYFHDTIIEHNKYYPLLMKIFALSILSYTALSGFPVLAERINLLLFLVSTILFTNIYYTIKPRWAGITAVILVAFAYLNISITSIDLSILWVKNK